MVNVKLYKTVNGQRTLRAEFEYETIERAIEVAEEWESRTPDNLAVYSK